MMEKDKKLKAVSDFDVLYEPLDWPKVEAVSHSGFNLADLIMEIKTFKPKKVWDGYNRTTHPSSANIVALMEKEDQNRYGPSYDYASKLKQTESTLLSTSVSDHDMKNGAIELIDMCLDALDIRAKAVLEGVIKPTPNAIYLTQKAQGLYSNFHTFPSVEKLQPVFVLPYFSYPNSGLLFREPMFGRPAPVKPRHGFVESRKVSCYRELIDLFKETLMQDPFGEVILMRKLSGEYSGIATNAGVTWGYGNDGVTSASGENKTVMIPSLTPVKVWNENVYQPAEKQAYYIELVTDKYFQNEMQNYIVQRREGPAQSSETNYIPKDTVIKHILTLENSKAYGDLIKWEKHLKSLAKGEKNPESIVFYYPKGVLSSHFAVHAIELGMSVITTGVIPVIGDKLSKIKSSRKPLKDDDLKKLAKLIHKWEKKNFINNSNRYNEREVLTTAIAAFHANAQWDNSDMLLELRAMSFVAMTRFLSAAVIGELRHYNNRNALKTNVSKFMGFEKPAGSRESIYEVFLAPASPIDRKRLMKTATVDYRLAGWRSGFGGKKWSSVASRTHKFTEALFAFSRKPTQKSYKRLILTANIAMHVAHNNGPTFGKWLGGGIMNSISKAPTLGFMNVFATLFALEPDSV